MSYGCQEDCQNDARGDEGKDGTQRPFPIIFGPLRIILTHFRSCVHCMRAQE
jgi:hypothetical protein